MTEICLKFIKTVPWPLLRFSRAAFHNPAMKVFGRYKYKEVNVSTILMGAMLEVYFCAENRDNVEKLS